MRSDNSKIFLPGSTVGVMGGGQLGRMFAIAARRMGYRVHTFSPDEDTPTGQLADLEVAARYDDEIEIRTHGTLESSVRIRFDYELVRPSDGVVLACGHTVHASLDVNGRPRALPERVTGVLGR